ncbi:hypothetical protein UA32_12470 [Photobacterium angustum]|uniref:DUF4165 domain-containing protein n=1 Tax=Photobacterium angustum TaxID=661 RepID=A0ABX5H259_PHOAN|nr:Ig-like domain-containing protein [Photobacterium angustum]KJG37761.1 hypothetical protein UA32_12470 [Photobacterium angustum]PSX07028.1 DUF4165 domain-containing protein [Photobacterium angustum]
MKCTQLKWSVLLTFLSSSANAGLELFTYKSNGIDTEINANNLNFINNSGTIDAYVSAGLDRRILVRLYQDERLIIEEKTGVVGTSDRINIGDKTFYGKQISLNLNNDGDYKLEVTSLSLTDDIISVDNYHFTRDTIPPTFSDTIKFVRAGYSHGSIEHFGNTHATKELKLLGVTDASSGIASAVYFAEPTDRSRTRIEKPVTMLVDDNSNSANLHVAAALAADSNSYPNDHYNIGFRVTDRAGNVAEKVRQSYIISHCPTEPVEIEVFNTSTNMWQPYSNNMVIYDNPVKVRWKRSKPTFATDPTAPYGWNNDSEISYADQNFNYYERSFPYPQNYTYFHFYTKSGKVCYTYYLRSLKFTLAPGVGLAPQYRGVHYTLASSPNTWIESAHPKYNRPYSIPKVRIFADARPYRQKAWGSGINTCYIEPGASSCDATTDVAYNSGRGYSPRGIHLSKDDGSLQVHGGYLYTFWDFNPVVINSITHNRQEKLVKASLTDNDTVSDWRSSFWSVARTTFSYHDAGGVEHTFDATNTTIFDFNNREIELNLSSFEDGEYNLSLDVLDTYGNQSTASLDVIIDSTPPVISVINNGQTDFETVADLNEIQINLEDQSSADLVSVRLFGSIGNENVFLPIIRNTDNNGNQTFNIDKPRIFPTLLENEKYGIEILAKDAYSNETVFTKNFKYIPRNLITLKKQTLLPVAENLKNVTDQAIATIYSSSPLTIEGGMLATGIQDATITNRATSSYPINVDTAEGPVTVSAGATKEIKIDLGDAGSVLKVDVYPANAEAEGEAELMFDIQTLKSKWNQ